MTCTLVAGIGNIFFGDDAFGVEVIRRLRGRGLPTEVQAIDFGIRGFDLACALASGAYDQVLLVDAMPRGQSPGTLYLIEPEELAARKSGSVEPHALAPVQAICLAQSLAGEEGTRLPRLYVLGCEPQCLGSEDDPAMGLSPVVEAALEGALAMIDEWLARDRALAATSPGVAHA